MVSVVVSVFLTACQSTPQVQGQQKPQALEFRELRFEEEVPLFEDRESGPVLTLVVQIVEAMDPEVHDLLSTLFYDGMEAQDFLNGMVSGTIEWYRQDAQELMEDTEADENAYFLNWASEIVWQIEGQAEDFLVLSESVYQYAGGAHGVYGTTYHVIDLATEERLQVSDVLPLEAWPQVGEYLEERLLEEYSQYFDADAQPQSLQEAGFFEDVVEPSGDFYPSQEGISFNWDIYEIAPYVMGGQEILIPWPVIRGYLNEYGMELYKAFAPE